MWQAESVIMDQRSKAQRALNQQNESFKNAAVHYEEEARDINQSELASQRANLTAATTSKVNAVEARAQQVVTMETQAVVQNIEGQAE